MVVRAGARAFTLTSSVSKALEELAKINFYYK
jgi:hypothetical protein